LGDQCSEMRFSFAWKLIGWLMCSLSTTYE